MPQFDLVYYRQVAGGFECEVVDGLGAYFPSLVLRDGSPEVVYQGFTYSDFRHASRKRGWLPTSVDAHARVRYGGYPDAALGLDGTLHVLY